MSVCGADVMLISSGVVCAAAQLNVTTILSARPMLSVVVAPVTLS